MSDGFPLLQQNLTLSPPSVPTEMAHAVCRSVVEDFPLVTSVSAEVLSSANTIWRITESREADGRKILLYSSEDDIVHFVRIFLTDILLALGLHLKFNAEVTIKQIRPDICVLCKGMYLVGVVEVKKPGFNVLLEPTVLGELLDQMFLVEGFYGMGPVIGILTTGVEWVLTWFPADSNTLASAEIARSGVVFATPGKSTAAATIESVSVNRHSPPGGTPSQKSGHVYTVEVAADGLPGAGDDNAEISGQMERLLCTTEVMNINTDPHSVIQLLCSAFQIMASSRTYHRQNISRCLLKFHKDIGAVTFHPVSHEDIYHMVDFNKFPSKAVKTLVALEDLGRGSTGKAWLCVTLTKPRSAACVVKFDNKHVNSIKLVKEREMWNLLYPEFSHMVKIEKWSGADALIMPHFSTVLEQEREQYRDEVLDVLRNKFAASSKVHKDVRWRNIGKYINRGKVAIVLFDLYDVFDYDANAHNDWIDKAMKSLYEDM